MKISVRRVLDRELVNALYSEVNNPFKIKGKTDSLIERLERFNKKYYPYFEASLKMPFHRSNGYEVEIFTFCRDDVRKVI